MVVTWCMGTYIVPTFIAHTLSMLLCYLVIYLPHSSGRFLRQDQDEWSAKIAASLKKS